MTTSIPAGGSKKNAAVVDAHHDILVDVLRRRQMGEHAVLNSYWAPRLRQGGVNVQFFPVYLDTFFLPELALRQALRMVEAFHADIDEDGSQFARAENYAQIEAALAQGKIASVLAMEGAEAIGNDLEMFSLFYRLGLRVASFTWNRRTAFADGIGERETGGGLTTLGFAAVRELNRLGVLIDVSHISERGFFDVLNTTTQTVIASHSNARKAYDHPRNLSDEQIRALAKNGGVMGLLLHPGMIDLEKPTLARAVDHIAYVADLVGIEHVGLGTDLGEGFIMDSPGNLAGESLLPAGMLMTTIEGCAEINELPNLCAEMEHRGFNSEEIALVMGGNFMRVMQQVLVR